MSIKKVGSYSQHPHYSSYFFLSHISHLRILFEIVFEMFCILRSMPKRKRKVFHCACQQLFESSILSEDDSEELELEDEFSDGDEQIIPGEHEESDVEPFEGVVGMGAEGPVNLELDDEPIIEDVEEADAEPQPVSDTEPDAPPLNPVLKRDAIPCPTKNCIHRKKCRNGETSNVNVAVNNVLYLEAGHSFSTKQNKVCAYILCPGKCF